MLFSTKLILTVCLTAHECNMSPSPFTCTNGQWLQCVGVQSGERNFTHTHSQLVCVGIMKQLWLFIVQGRSLLKPLSCCSETGWLSAILGQSWMSKSGSLSSVGGLMCVGHHHPEQFSDSEWNSFLYLCCPLTSNPNDVIRVISAWLWRQDV